MIKPRLYATAVGPDDREVRFLVIEPDDTSRNATLTLIRENDQSSLGSGSEYSVLEQADRLLLDWTAGEGFTVKDPYVPVFGSLQLAKVVAAKMGYETIHAQRGTQGRSLPGEVPLHEWRGLVAKDGGAYAYAFGGTTIHAHPTHPDFSGIVMPADPRESAAFLLNSMKRLDRVGPRRQFLLGRNRYLMASLG